MANKLRCEWAGDDPLYIAYHDTDWGVPIYDDERLLFELLTLEGAQAGLSWITILRKRQNYKAAFDNFDVQKVARYDETKIAELLQNSGIIRNKLKVHSTVTNAQSFIQVQAECGSFGSYLWNYVDGQPLQNTWANLGEVPANTPLSDKISKDMKKRGFKFVGSTIIYAYMQSSGMVNDHTTACFRHEEVKALRR